MVWLMPKIQAAGDRDKANSIPLAVGLFISVSALVALCAKHAIARRKYSTNDSKFAPTPSPGRQLMTTISNKAIIPFIHHRKSEAGAEPEAEVGAGSGGETSTTEGFGEGGLWQKAILMGEKCQPPEFPGVIYYDCDGKRISELPPRSPRASPLRSFSFPVVEDAN